MARDDRGDCDLTKRIDVLTSENKRLKFLATELYVKLIKERKKIQRYRKFVKYLEGGISGRKTDY
jgi:hypothetical protein